MLPRMDVDPHGPDAELAALIAEWGGRFLLYAPGPGAPCWLAYDRLRPDMPAITADSPGELRDHMARVTPGPARPAAGHITR